MTNYVFIVDTNEYSGNFEREMCAYLTGMVGDCGIGNGESKIFSKEASPEAKSYFELHVDSRPDEDGCHRPCEIYPTPGRANTGMGYHYDLDEDPEKVQHEHLKSINSISEFFGEQIDFNDEVYKIGKFPAYESVAIFFNTKPKSEYVELMKLRAEKFCNLEENQGLKIVGFRLIQDD